MEGTASAEVEKWDGEPSLEGSGIELGESGKILEDFQNMEFAFDGVSSKALWSEAREGVWWKGVWSAHKMWPRDLHGPRACWKYRISGVPQTC